MWHVVYGFFVWCQATSVGEAIRNSQWLFPVVETFHLLALSVMGGMVLAVDLRLVQASAAAAVAAKHRRATSSRVAGFRRHGRHAEHAGFILFLSEALKCWDNGAFWMKMEFLLAALIFTFTVRRWYTQRDDARINPGLAKMIGLVSLALWTGVGIGGRGIGFY